MSTVALLLALCLAVPVADEPEREVVIVLAKSGHAALFVGAGSGRELFRVPTGRGPHEVAVSPDGALAVVSDYGTVVSGAFAPGRTLTVIDLAARAVARTIDLGSPCSPHGLRFLADGRLLVTAERSRALLVVDPASGEVRHSFETDADASHMVAATPDGRRAFVANIGSGSVTAFDLGSGERLAQIPTGAGCEGLAVTPDGRHAWATNRAAGTLSIIDTDTLAVVGELGCPGFPIRVQFTPDGARALVSCATSSELRVFDVRGRRLLATLPIALDVVDDAGERLFGAAMQGSPTPVGVLVSPLGDVAWVAATNADVVVRIDLEELAIDGGFRAGPEPDGLGFATLPDPPAPPDEHDEG